MSCRRLALVLVGLLCVAACEAGAAGVDGPSLPAADEQLLKSAQLTISGPGLLDFFRKRTPADVHEKTLATLVQQLGERAQDVQNRAVGDLIAYGPTAIPLLRQAANDLNQPDAAARARHCLERIEGPEGANLIGAAARALAIFKPAGAADVLLAYQPFTENEQTSDAVTQALVAVALREGKPEPALLKALDDPLASRRACAAVVLSQAGGDEQRTAVRRLLKDPKASVRLRAALALAQANDTEAIPVLIDLLAELTAEEARPAEDFLTHLAGEWRLSIPSGNDDIARRLRKEVWAAWWRGTEGPALLDELRKRTPSETDRERIVGLIRQLDDPAPAVRDRALGELQTLGAMAIPLLRQAINDPNFKAREQAQQCLQILDRGQAIPLPTAVARLVALRKPVGAVEALLAYLPSAEEEGAATEVQTALTLLAYRDSKPDPALVLALEDRAWQRRAAAAEALCRPGQEDARPQVRKLMQDPEPAVRLRATLALVSARDRQAVPTLIALLGELPIEQAVQAETYLRTLAGEQAPALSVAGEAGAQQRCREAWSAWWREHGGRVDLARIDPAQRMLGFTLVVEQHNQARRSGRVSEIDLAGKMRWEITGLQTAFDAQVVSGERVLIVEQGISRVSERDFKGNITWQRQLNLPLAAQRLPNGNTFIAGRGQLLEVDRNGKEVFTFPRPNNDIMAAQKLRDGQIAYITYAWMYTRLDARGKEMKTFRLGPFQYYTNAVHILPNDHVLVPDYNGNRVTEFNAEGKKVWEVSVPMPSGAERLPNGNTLISSVGGMRIVEVNRAGKVVWEHKESFNPWRARRR